MTKEAKRGDRIPRSYEKFCAQHGEVIAAYDDLNERVKDLGALSEEALALTKLAISVGAGMDGAMASQTRKALKAGIEPKKIEQVAILALPTLGLPRMMQAWKTITMTISKWQG